MSCRAHIKSSISPVGPIQLGAILNDGCNKAQCSSCVINLWTSCAQHAIVDESNNVTHRLVNGQKRRSYRWHSAGRQFVTVCNTARLLFKSKISCRTNCPNAVLFRGQHQVRQLHPEPSKRRGKTSVRLSMLQLILAPRASKFARVVFQISSRLV